MVAPIGGGCAEQPWIMGMAARSSMAASNPDREHWRAQWRRRCRAAMGAGAVRAWEKKNGSTSVFKSGGPQDCPAIGKRNSPDFRGTTAENECPAFLLCHWLDHPAPCIR